MNEVGAGQSPRLSVVAATASRSTLDHKPEPGGKHLPPSAAGQGNEPEKSAAPAAVDKLEAVARAVQSLNDYVQSIGRDLSFSVDEELQKTVVKVVESSTGKLVRQIPDEVFLDLARRLNDDSGFRLIDELT